VRSWFGERRRSADRGDATLAALGASGVVDARSADVGRARRAYRRRRWTSLVLLTTGGTAAAGTPLLWLATAPGAGTAVAEWAPILLPVVFFGLLIGLMVAAFVVPGRSPHEVIRPEQLDVRLDDVVGIDVVKEDVVRSLNLFLAHETFARVTGGRVRRGLLFEGPPGTGKTHTAKAVAKEAGVPFLFASATSFQSSFYGATAKKIRSYFRELRRIAEREGGAIGFIDEFDAIAGARRGMESTAHGLGVHPCSGTAFLPSSYALPATALHPLGTADLAGPVVNELLVQLQSFETVSRRRKALARLTERVNRVLPARLALRNPALRPANILLIASTNRAAGLDPALLRPGRFDRTLSFDNPDRAGRRALTDHFLARRAHAPELDDDDIRDALAALTGGWSPARLEHVFDEALVLAVRRGETAMTWADVQEARLVEEVGLGQPVSYTDGEKRLVATHEAGHCVVAWLLMPERRLDVLTIVKRRNALGLLAHSDRHDVYTRSRSELTAMIRIAMGGQCAEELFVGDISTGPAGDLLYATNVAAEMVGAAGMTGSLISYAAVQNSAFSDSNLVGRVLADARGRASVEGLLAAQKRYVLDLLSAHRHLVEALRDALLDRHELLGAEITDVLEAAREAGLAPAPVPAPDPPAGLALVIDLTGRPVEGDPATLGR
jgi:ATP-dependent Zn protease